MTTAGKLSECIQHGAMTVRVTDGAHRDITDALQRSVEGASLRLSNATDSTYCLTAPAPIHYAEFPIPRPPIPFYRAICDRKRSRQ